MSFHIGQKVVCIFDAWSRPYGEDVPQKDQIYTIRDIIHDSKIDQIGFRLHEIRNIPHPFTRSGKEVIEESAFNSHGFRPLIEKKLGTETGMAILRKIAQDASKERELVIEKNIR